MPHAPATRGHHATPSSPTLPKITPRDGATASYATDPVAPKAKTLRVFGDSESPTHSRATQRVNLGRW